MGQGWCFPPVVTRRRIQHACRLERSLIGRLPAVNRAPLLAGWGHECDFATQAWATPRTGAPDLGEEELRIVPLNSTASERFGSSRTVGGATAGNTSRP